MNFNETTTFHNNREKRNVESFKSSIECQDLSLLIGNCKDCEICCNAVLNSRFYIYLISFKLVYIREDLKTGIAKISTHSTTWQLKIIKLV